MFTSIRWYHLAVRRGIMENVGRTAILLGLLGRHGAVSCQSLLLVFGRLVVLVEIFDLGVPHTIVLERLLISWLNSFFLLHLKNLCK